VQLSIPDDRQSPQTPVTQPFATVSSSDGVMYLVAAVAEQPGIPRALADRPRRFEPTAQPVGLQHATARSIGAAPPQRALCGAEVGGWIVFADRQFEPGCSASCQRCAQLVAAAMQTPLTEHGTSGRANHILPAGLGQRVRARSLGDVVVLSATGRLSDVLDDLNLAARYALAGEPRAVVCDVSGLGDAGAPGALRRLALNGRHPRDWPGVPLAVAGLDRQVGDAMGQKPLGCYLVVTTSLARALSILVQAGPPFVQTLRLSPHPTAPRASRDFVSRVLLEWGLSRHLPAACLVVSELVTNAMIHAGTGIDVRISEHRKAIRIAVRDRSHDMPVPRPDSLEPHGRGLTIVAGLSSAWGVLHHTDGGKVVWAVIDSTPRVVEAAGATGHR
jgi:anti-sigma regulatory factor (Ser/Thr protein kinase)